MKEHNVIKEQNFNATEFLKEFDINENVQDKKFPNLELKLEEKNKPILAVNPWGQERGSGIVKKNANKLVGWNANSVVDGIWKLYNNVLYNE